MKLTSTAKASTKRDSVDGVASLVVVDDGDIYLRVKNGTCYKIHNPSKRGHRIGEECFIGECKPYYGSVTITSED